jgi:hypothetical protein
MLSKQYVKITLSVTGRLHSLQPPRRDLLRLRLVLPLAPLTSLESGLVGEKAPQAARNASRVSSVAPKASDRMEL